MFRGAFTALVTPFRDGEVDEDALVALTEAQISAGIHGLVPCGTTGESPALSHAENIRVVELVTQTNAGRVPIIAGAGSNCTKEAIELALACKELGVSATLQVTPYYNKPEQAGAIAHMTAIADATKLPVIVYNVPGRTVCDLLPETIATMAQHEHIVGVKEATASMVRAARIRELCGNDFALLSGDDFTLMPFLALGGDGVISVGSNLVPGLFARMCNAADEGRWDDARDLHYKQLPLTRALFAQSNPIVVKSAMARLGFCAPEIRLPLQILPNDGPHMAALETELRNLELLS